MITIRRVLIGLLISSFTSNSFAECVSLDTIEWLNHRWISKTAKKLTVESWIRVSDASFEGVGEDIDVSSGNVIFSESLRILEMSGEVFFLAKVKENALPVSFKLIECSQELAIFENSAHDFPQRLEYRRKSENSLKVSLSGQQGRSFDVVYTKQDD